MDSSVSSKENDPVKKYKWNNNHDSILEWPEFQSTIKDKLEELGITHIESEDRCDEWIGPAPINFDEASMDEIVAMTSIELQRYNAMYGYAKDKKIEFQKKVDVLKIATAKAIAFIRRSFYHISNAYVKIDEVAQAPFIVNPLKPMSAWREDYRWRAIWNAVVTDFKPMTEENKKYYEELIKSCNDKNQSFACFEGEYKSLAKKLSDMGFPLRDEEHRDLIGANLTNVNLVTQKSNYLSKSYDLDHLWKLCRDYLATMNKHDTGVSSTVKARSVTFVDQYEAQSSRTQGGDNQKANRGGIHVNPGQPFNGCYRCAREGHVLRECVAKSCSICGKQLSSGESHKAKNCVPASQGKKKRDSDSNARQGGPGKDSGGGNGGANQSFKGRKHRRTGDGGAGASGSSGSSANSSSGGVAPTASAVVGNATA